MPTCDWTDQPSVRQEPAAEIQSSWTGGGRHKHPSSGVPSGLGARRMDRQKTNNRKKKLFFFFSILLQASMVEMKDQARSETSPQAWIFPFRLSTRPTRIPSDVKLFSTIEIRPPTNEAEAARRHYKKICSQKSSQATHTLLTESSNNAMVNKTTFRSFVFSTFIFF